MADCPAAKPLCTLRGYFLREGREPGGVAGKAGRRDVPSPTVISAFATGAYHGAGWTLSHQGEAPEAAVRPSPDLPPSSYPRALPGSARTFHTGYPQRLTDKSLRLGSAESRQGRVVIPWKRAEILPVEFDPGVGTVIEGLHRQADDEFCGIPLLAKKAVQDQGVGEAGRPPGSQVECAEYRTP